MDRKCLREAYGNALVEAGRANNSVVVLDADLSKSTRTSLFEEQFPNRFFEMGIAEQNMMSTAAGLAIAGKIPFVNTFAVFAAGRAYDQIRQSICIPRLNVKICGSSAGLSDYGDGATHQAIDDVALMRALPNMTVFAPSDATETEMMVRAMVDHDSPVYMRISRSLLPNYIDSSVEYRFGSPTVLRDGKDLVVFANGSLIEKSMEAAATLDLEGISLRVVNVSTIKPLDVRGIHECMMSMRGIVTAEEHSVIGGIGSAIVCALSDVVGAPPVKMIGVEDRFGTSAENFEELMREYGLTAEAIAEAARELAAATSGKSTMEGISV